MRTQTQKIKPVIVQGSKANYLNPFSMVVLSIKLYFNGRVSIFLKMFVTVLQLVAIAYWIWPFDFLPALPFDDITVMMIPLYILVFGSPAEIVREAQNQNAETAAVIEAKSNP
ncbi:hypothetical protein CO180_03605 [candidate division WWE3 bacterium CG_4_9_14_3_um_filter_41_6]|uniref:Uncharacterized protein n=1 Tax=candidate division WWE3 bacterium CG_4_10_14_0_2_um_filter_41_14 TaxID=1975072 RepID=A0A2M7THH4_UNCKA|nr:MAG: hypothetical protein COY32_04880 [candidate division WWE3 bacterium CG_4_10_14_0_2_um_filter_41_14]PJA38420.1 MAG: hypothetical protein CO180_03605 [candidate division WWE3 bacterium CG_4_9_14_3_um_filter_41_6]